MRRSMADPRIAPLIGTATRMTATAGRSSQIETTALPATSIG
jgi:hypothetical protein